MRTAKILAEGLGSALLLATVIGSGIMGAKLAGGNVAIALLANSIATGSMLVVLITIFAPISGAHLNPAVTLAFAIRKQHPWALVAPYIISQLAGALLGVWLGHAMFDLPVWQMSATARTGTGQWLAEATATFGLLLTIFGSIAAGRAMVPFAVGLYITAAYWFTASTSFANPAVTLARAFSDTFAGIAPSSVAPFIVAQLLGLALSLLVAGHLWPQRE